MKQQRFSISKRLKSFKYAFNGLRILIKEEHNARIHLFAAICVIIAGLFFNISMNEWISVIFSIGLVFSLEIINSSIENIADFISPERHEMIKKIKDLSASGVLISAITALIIGLIIFIPKILKLC
ncbi:MAG: diacylglycerol kinase family protein [Bacteroidales bacterium]|nr:diacylglycerol kinase family protein [Bacteroidales bacterium]